MNETSTGSAATRQWGGNAVVPDDLDVRLGMIKALSQDADHWRRSGKWRQIGFLLTWFLLMIAVIVVVVLSFSLYSQNNSLQELQRQLQLALDATEAIDSPFPREVKHDRAMVKVLREAQTSATEDDHREPEARRLLRKTIGRRCAASRRRVHRKKP